LDKYLIPAFPGTLRAITTADAEAYLRQRRTAENCPRCDGKGKVAAGGRYGREAPACPRCKGVKEIAPSPSTLNREVTVLKHMMRRAVVWEYLSRNPFLDSQGGVLSGLKALREPGGRTRFLNLEEIDRLLASCEPIPYLKAFATVALNTGMRRNEILSLTRKSVDWQNRTAALTETKNGETRQVYLNDVALEALRALPRPIDDGRLFPAPCQPSQHRLHARRAPRGHRGFSAPRLQAYLRELSGDGRHPSARPTNSTRTPGRPHDRALLAPERRLPESGRRWRRAWAPERRSCQGSIERSGKLNGRIQPQKW
jgi:hypothetical protein